MMKLSDELWEDSQKNELHFWQKELSQDNLDQRQRNVYYLSKMEGHCSLIKDFVEANDFKYKVIMDLGSGPQGIMHAIDSFVKIAVDPLMDEFRNLGFDIDRDNVMNVNAKAEDIAAKLRKDFFDVVFCLNSIDHHQDPQLVIDNIHQVLRTGGDLILLTDTRLPEQCDAYHKLPLTQEAILSWLQNWDILETQEFPHGAGNPIMQFIVHAKKRAPEAL
jgi:2-polyprenyl-3-methyl-5-hydroxy-6-metoxy-1,4-benzoquinol methylase